MHKAQVVDVADASLILRVAGSVGDIDSLMALLESFGVKEVVRTGSIAMIRGSATTREPIELEGPTQ